MAYLLKHERILNTIAGNVLRIDETKQFEEQLSLLRDNPRLDVLHRLQIMPEGEQDSYGRVHHQCIN